MATMTKYIAFFLFGFTVFFTSSANATPADTTKNKATVDSMQLRQQIINILHDLGVKTAEDTTAIADTGAVEKKKHRHGEKHGFEFRIGNSLYPASDPGPYFDWQKFSGFRYNRVDGLFLGLGSSTPRFPDDYKDFIHYEEYDDSGRTIRIGADGSRDTLTPKDWRLTGGFGYAFGSHFWTVEGGLSHVTYLGDRSRDAMLNALEIGAEGHIRTDTRDAWLIDEDENTLTSLFAREDFQDYFKRQGFSVNGTWHIGAEHLMLSYRDDRFNNLIERDYFTFFGGHKVF